MRIFLFFGLLIAFISLMSCRANDVVYAPFFKGSKNLDNPYGVCSHINRTGFQNEYDTREKELKQIKEAGVSLLRTDFDWGVCQKNHSELYDFTRYDTILTECKNNKVDVLGILTHLPQRNFSEWLDYVENVSRHYSKRVKYWEVLNEADRVYKWIPGFRVSTYNEYIESAYRAIKRNSNASVVYSGLADACDGTIEQLLQEEKSRCYDIMNIHWYANKEREPEEIIDYCERYAEILNRYQIYKPVWLTETGCTIAPHWASEMTQADRLPRIFLISFALGIDKVFWYKTRSSELDSMDREGYFGLWHKDYMPMPAFYAYQTLTRLCPDKSTRPQLIRDGSVYVAFWRRPDKKKVWALWTTKGRQTISVSVNGHYSAINNMGHIKQIDVDKVEISPSVTYVVGAKNLTIRDI